MLWISYYHTKIVSSSNPPHIYFALVSIPVPNCIKSDWKFVFKNLSLINCVQALCYIIYQIIYILNLDFLWVNSLYILSVYLSICPGCWTVLETDTPCFTNLSIYLYIYLAIYLLWKYDNKLSRMLNSPGYGYTMLH